MGMQKAAVDDSHALSNEHEGADAPATSVHNHTQPQCMVLLMSTWSRGGELQQTCALTWLFLPTVIVRRAMRLYLDSQGACPAKGNRLDSMGTGPELRSLQFTLIFRQRDTTPQHKSGQLV